MKSSRLFMKSSLQFCMLQMDQCWYLALAAGSTGNDSTTTLNSLLLHCPFVLQCRIAGC